MSGRVTDGCDGERLSPSFYRSEFACKGDRCCGHSAPINQVLVDGLQALRDKLSCTRRCDTPIGIMSGFRCIIHDRDVAVTRGFPRDLLSNRHSQHCLGNAADVVVEDVDVELVLSVAETIAVFRDGGIGCYSGSRGKIVHLDVRTDGPARWRE